MNANNLKIYKKSCSMLLTASLSLSILSGCGSNYNGELDENNSTKYEAGTHLLLEVDRNLKMIGRDGKYGLTAPDGYTIVDYDYDKWDDFEFNDYVYLNDEDVYVVDSDKPGVPVTTHEDSEVYKPGEHIIVDIDRGFNATFGKKDTTFALTAPVGYDILDYDYDKTDYFDFENITYVNNTDVTLESINEFGTPTSDITEKEHTDGNYQIGEHILVELKRNSNPFLGKDEKKQITAPVGYRIVDYDYDKTSFFEFETITYENIVPVHVDDVDTFGSPLEKVDEQTIENNIYKPGDHVLVEIDRDLNLFYGFNGTRELKTVDGYTLLDYDYDKTDNFDFETYVYVNNQNVYVEDVNDFGEVVSKESVKKLGLNID